MFNFVTNNVTYTVVFNGGRRSGSSQPRQHVQFLQLQSGTPLDRLVEEAVPHPFVENGFQIAPFKGKNHCVFKFRSEYADNAEGEYEFTAENIHALYVKALTSLGISVSAKI